MKKFSSLARVFAGIGLVAMHLTTPASAATSKRRSEPTESMTA